MHTVYRLLKHRLLLVSFYIRQIKERCASIASALKTMWGGWLYTSRLSCNVNFEVCIPKDLILAYCITAYCEQSSPAPYQGGGVITLIVQIPGGTLGFYYHLLFHVIMKRTINKTSSKLNIIIYVFILTHVLCIWWTCVNIAIQNVMILVNIYTNTEHMHASKLLNKLTTRTTIKHRFMAMVIHPASVHELIVTWTRKDPVQYYLRCH